MTKKEIIRTPESRFENLEDYHFKSHYMEVEEGLRLHYLDEGNDYGGIKIFPSANATIGGPTRAHGNIIVNNVEGIRLSSNSEIVVRNYKSA